MSAAEDALVEAMAAAVYSIDPLPKPGPGGDDGPLWLDATFDEVSNGHRNRLRQKARAALAALRQHRPDVAAVLGGWQPIETAPKDGSDVLIRCPGDSVHEARWIDWSNSRYDLRHRLTGWYWAGYDGAVGPVFPTHWRPLPPPPECAP